MRSPGFLVLLALLGLALLWRGLQWYDGHLREISTPRSRLATARATPPAATPSPKPTPTPAKPLPAPTAEEIAALATQDAARQAGAARVLLERQTTPELAAALESVRPLDTWAEEAIACLWARVGGPRGIDEAVQWLERQDAIWPGSVDQALCVVSALGEHANEAPDRVRDALIPYAMAMPARLRTAALDGLARVPVREMPPKLREAAAGAVSASMPVYAALALGLDEETAPEVVEEFLQSAEPSARAVMSRHLTTSPKPAAVALVVERLVRDPGDPGRVQLAVVRNEKKGDVAPALVEVALDEKRPLHERQAALEQVAAMGDASLVAALEPLALAPDASLRAYAEAALAALRARRR